MVAFGRVQQSLACKFFCSHLVTKILWPSGRFKLIYRGPSSTYSRWTAELQSNGNNKNLWPSSISLKEEEPLKISATHHSAGWLAPMQADRPFQNFYIFSSSFSLMPPSFWHQPRKISLSPFFLPSFSISVRERERRRCAKIMGVSSTADTIKERRLLLFELPPSFLSLQPKSLLFPPLCLH